MGSPSLADGILEIINSLNLRLIEKEFSLKELLKSDEVFITSSGSLITPITQVDKVKINKGLSRLSNDEQSRSGLKDCTEDEFNMFQKLNYNFKEKFNIPFILAVRNKNKNEIIEDFKNRLNNSDIEKEIEISINQIGDSRTKSRLSNEISRQRVILNDKENAYRNLLESEKTIIVTQFGI